MQSRNKPKKDHVTKNYKKDNVEIAKNLNSQEEINLTRKHVIKNSKKSQSTACANPSKTRDRELPPKK